ncbi:hypothetical protein C5167_014350 [Papaver somniferum]|uniref:CASP-like protein n=1 Tax=Papaver somniferum TaxID=3469 RepID=A0A4Y7J6V2_PAPSO|nr:CASP-like protein 1D1 [Papaver somniferum]XP_026456630.1 CASP-like protein 1D1 [Papaver somniferum]RZC55498.1 hypothetical protein C5167_014350 [Papaver somniferum]
MSNISGGLRRYLSEFSFIASVGLRKLLFWTVLVAAIVIHTSKQTEDEKTTNYTHYPAYKYLLSILWAVFAYTFFAAIYELIYGKTGKKHALLSLLFCDTIMLTLLASATGTAGAVLYIGKNGNSRDGCSKICAVFGRFCRHMEVSFGMSIFACFLLVWIILYSAGAIKQ